MLKYFTRWIKIYESFFTCFFFCNVASTKFKITYVTYVILAYLANTYVIVFFIYRPCLKYFMSSDRGWVRI